MELNTKLQNLMQEQKDNEAATLTIKHTFEIKLKELKNKQNTEDENSMHQHNQALDALRSKLLKDHIEEKDNLKKEYMKKKNVLENLQKKERKRNNMQHNEQEKLHAQQDKDLQHQLDEMSNKNDDLNASLSKSKHDVDVLKKEMHNRIFTMEKQYQKEAKDATYLLSIAAKHAEELGSTNQALSTIRKHQDERDTSSRAPEVLPICHRCSMPKEEGTVSIGASFLHLQLRTKQRPTSSDDGGAIRLLPQPLQDDLNLFTNSPQTLTNTITFEKCLHDANTARQTLENAQQSIRECEDGGLDDPKLAQLKIQRNEKRVDLLSALSAIDATFDGHAMRKELEEALFDAVVHRKGMEALLAIKELKDVVDADDNEDLASATCIAISRQNQGGGSLDFIASLKEQSVIASKIAKEATEKVQNWIQSHDPTFISRSTDAAVRKAREALQDAISNDPNEDKKNTFYEWKEANEQAMCAIVSEWQHWDNRKSPLQSFPANICLKAMEVAVELSNALSTFSQQARDTLQKVRKERAILSTLKDVPQEQIDALKAIEDQYFECYDEFDVVELALRQSRRRSQSDRVKKKEQELETVRIKLQRIQRSRESARASLVELAVNHYPELACRKDIQLGTLSGEEAGILTMGRKIAQ